jgi:hypothetical protein
VLLLAESKQEMFADQIPAQLSATQASRRRIRHQRTRPNLSQACRKTKLCTYHLQGFCPNGANCGFAHGDHELVLPPNLGGTKLCPLLKTGGCTREGCKFAHSEQELRDIGLASPQLDLKTLGHSMFSLADADAKSEASTHGSGSQSELPASEDSNDSELWENETATPTDLYAIHAPEGCEVIVQHTFLHLRSMDASDDDARSAYALRERRRATSCPAPHVRTEL